MKNEIDKTTARPWRIRGTNYGYTNRHVLGPPHKDGSDYSALCETQNEIDAALIVTAVNLYEAHCALEELVRRGLLNAHNQRQINSRIGMPFEETQWEIDAKQALAQLETAKESCK